MLGLIITAIVLYLLVGIGILIYGVVSDPYGGYFLQFWWVVILFYPYIIIRSLLDK